MCSGRGGKKSLAPHWIQGPAESRLHPQDSAPVPLILTQLPVRKQTYHQPHKQQEADKDVCLSQKRSFFLLYEVPNAHSALGWGTIIRTVEVGRRAAAPWAHWGRSSKLGIALVIVHLVEALEHILLTTCKRSELMQRVCSLNKHRSRVQIYWQIKLPPTLIKHFLSQSTLKGQQIQGLPSLQLTLQHW